jgi:hypothetical protein
MALMWVLCQRQQIARPWYAVVPTATPTTLFLPKIAEVRCSNVHAPSVVNGCEWSTMWKK